MTALDLIYLWVLYSLYGAADEHDAGNPEPRQFGMISSEKGYVSPGRNHWDAPEIKAHPDDVRAAYCKVEAVYKSLPNQDRRLVKAHYYGYRHRSQDDAVARFVAAVERAIK